MKAIEVRDLPEETYKTLCRRAQRAGKPVEAYARDELIALAARPTKHEAIEEIEAILKHSNLPSPSIESILEDLDADRH
jgi:plasmid stability protein